MCQVVPRAVEQHYLVSLPPFRLVEVHDLNRLLVEEVVANQGGSAVSLGLLRQLLN